MNKITILTDYKGFFGSKHDGVPYRSGFDKELLKREFLRFGIETDYVPISCIDPGESKWKGTNVLYTSSEDRGYVYKQYIEDVVMALSINGANVIPSYKFFHANNNKTFMELLRDSLLFEFRGNIRSFHFGCLEELMQNIDKIVCPVVVKGSSGAMGTSVFLANNTIELIQIIKKKISQKSTLWFGLKEILRGIKYKGYIRESFYRGKFIIQEYIPGLKNDWKVYFFGTKSFVFYRPILKNRGFRASGGGYDNYSYGNNANMPEGLLEFGWKIFNYMNVPNASFDIAWDGKIFYLLEFQCIYFGTAGILKRYSTVFYQKSETGWKEIINDGIIERVYAESISWFIKNH